MRRLLPGHARAILAALLLGAAPPLMAAGTTLVPVSGTVDGAGESVAFTGSVEIRAKLVEDRESGAPASVQLIIDLGKMAGTGTSTGRAYVTATQEVVTRPLGVADLVDIAFSFVPTGERGAPRSGRLTLNLGFDLATGDLLGASAEVAPLVLPDAADCPAADDASPCPP